MVYTRSIDESDWYVSIAGVKNVQVNNVNELIENVRKVAYNHYFQLFDAEKIAGWEHIYHGAINAVKSFQSGSAISKSLDMEVLLYVACLDQISKAIEAIGISSDVSEIAVIVFGKSSTTTSDIIDNITQTLGEPDDQILIVNQKKYASQKDIFEISQESIDTVGGASFTALTKLIIEKGALLSLQR